MKYFKKGDKVLLKHDIKYRKGNEEVLVVVGFDDDKLILENPNRGGVKSRKVQMRSYVSPSDVVSYKYAEGGEMKFDEGGEIDIEDLPIEIQDVLEKYSYEEEDYDTMLKMEKELNSLGYTFDFGLDAIPTNFRKMKKGGQVGEIKDAIDILESLGDDIDDNVKQALDMLKIVYDEMELPEQPKSIEDIIGENAYKKGGRMKFRDKVDAIADRLEGTKVPKRLRKDYGVTFNREEAEMSGRRIVGSMVKKYGK